MKGDNRASIVTTRLTDKDYAALKQQAENMGISVSELADLAMSEGIKQKFKRPSKGLVKKFNNTVKTG